MKNVTAAVLVFIFSAFSDLNAAPEPSVKFLAVGNPSAIRIQGESKTLVTEKIEWKEGKLSGVFHVPLDNLETGISLRDKHMKEKYLETAKYPNADLILNACAVKEVETPCDGTLTLHGVTKPVSIRVKGTSSGEKTLRVDADFGIKLTDYAIELPKFANIKVAEEVQIQVASETAKP